MHQKSLTKSNCIRSWHCHRSFISLFIYCSHNNCCHFYYCCSLLQCLFSTMYNNVSKLVWIKYCIYFLVFKRTVWICSDNVLICFKFICFYTFVKQILVNPTTVTGALAHIWYKTMYGFIADETLVTCDSRSERIIFFPLS